MADDLHRASSVHRPSQMATCLRWDYETERSSREKDLAAMPPDLPGPARLARAGVSFDQQHQLGPASVTLGEAGVATVTPTATATDRTNEQRTRIISMTPSGEALGFAPGFDTKE